MYCISAVNKIVAVTAGVIPFCAAVWFYFGLIDSWQQARLAHEGLNTTATVATALVLFVFALFMAVRPFYMRVIVAESRVEVVGVFGTQIIRFAEIAGRRDASGRGVRGMYLYRQNKSRVFVRESLFRQDDFYKRWRASIYDLDKADRLDRKAEGKERPLDWFAVDNSEQHATIGGPKPKD